MKKLADSARKAAFQTSAVITSDIQSLASQSGWDDEVASNTIAMFNGHGFTVEVPSDLNSRAMDYEYGTSSSRPSGVLRKISNRPQKIEAAIVQAMEKELGIDL